MSPAGAVGRSVPWDAGRSVPWDAGRSAGVQSWQDYAVVRSRAAGHGKMLAKCVPRRPTVARYRRGAFSGGDPWQLFRFMRSRRGLGREKRQFAATYRRHVSKMSWLRQDIRAMHPKSPQTGVRGYTARRSCQEGAIFAARAPQIMHGARILPRPDGAEQHRGVRRTRYAAAPVAPVAPARCRSSSRARGARPTAFAASAILRPQHSPAPRSESAAAFSGTSLCSIESAHPPYIFIRRTRGGVFQLMLQEQLRFLPPRRMPKRAVRLPWCTGPNPLAISTSSMRKARQSLSTTTQGSRRPSRPNGANTSTVSRCTRLISPSFAL